MYTCTESDVFYQTDSMKKKNTAFARLKTYVNYLSRSVFPFDNIIRGKAFKNRPSKT